nr:unnamed protein product [Callosobruchus chinensis]
MFLGSQQHRQPQPRYSRQNDQSGDGHVLQGLLWFQSFRVEQPIGGTFAQLAQHDLEIDAEIHAALTPAIDYWSETSKKLFHDLADRFITGVLLVTSHCCTRQFDLSVTRS